MSTTVLFLVAVAVIAANQAVLRLATLRRNPWVFWILQGLNLVVACYVFLFGLPGFDVGYTRWFGYVIGLLLVFRIVQNNMLRQRFLRQEVEARRAEERRERAKQMAMQLAASHRDEASDDQAPDTAPVPDGVSSTDEEGDDATEPSRGGPVADQ